MKLTMTSKFNYPTTDEEIDTELARQLYEQHCAILIVENLPLGSELGIDLSSFVVGEKFRGIKLIPPGIHFVFANSIDKAGRHGGSRSGFYHEYREKELIIKKWSPRDEDFDETYVPSEAELERYSTNLRELDRYLGAYRFSTYRDFLGLTDHLSVGLVKSLSPNGGLIRAAPHLIKSDQATSSAEHLVTGSKRQPRRRLTPSGEQQGPKHESELLPDLQQDPNARLRFTQIPIDHSFSQLASGPQITQYSLDTTTKLEHTFGIAQEDLSKLVGEFQFAFVTLLLGQVYDCFEHWRQLLMLVCRADLALGKCQQFFIDFLSTLSKQLQQVPEDLFEDILDQENLIRYNLDVLFQNIGSMETQSDELARQADAVRQLVADKFKWQFNLELEDEQPVVVEL